MHRTLNNFLRKSTYHTQHQLSPNGRATRRDRTPIPHALPFGSPQNNQIPAKRKSYRQGLAKQRDHVGFDGPLPAPRWVTCSAPKWARITAGSISAWFRERNSVCVLICHSGRSRGVSTPMLVWAEAASISASASRRGAWKRFFRQICETVHVFVSLEKTQLPGKQRDCKTQNMHLPPQREQRYQPHFA